MTKITASKRKAFADPDDSSEQLTINMQSKCAGKTCIVCREAVHKSQFVVISKHCRGKHDNNVCRHCWTKFIAIDILGSMRPELRCVECLGTIDYEKDFKRIAERHIVEHYDWLIRKSKMEENGEHACCRVHAYEDGPLQGSPKACHGIQKHDPATDGRIFKCKDCGESECVHCTVPEHKGESCVDFQARMCRVHAEEETKSAQAFEARCFEIHPLDKAFVKKKSKNAIHDLNPCERCGSWLERERKCAHVKCVKCMNEFCLRCTAPYFGEGGVYDVGNAAHQAGCPYFERKKEDKRCKRRKITDKKRSSRVEGVEDEREETGDSGFADEHA